MDVSGISQGLNKSTFEERQKNLLFLRQLYFLVVIEILVALLWSIWVRESETLGNGVYRYWGFALFTGIASILLLFVATFVGAVRNTPLNYVIYGLFTIFAAYTWGYFCAWDNRTSGYDFVFYWLCLLTAICVVLFLQSMGTNNYQYSLSAFLWIVSACCFVFFIFLCFSDISVIRLVICTVPTIVYGYFLSYNVRKMVTPSHSGQRFALR